MAAGNAEIFTKGESLFVDVCKVRVRYV